MSFKSIHIFGYGETQLITENINKIVLTTDLTKVQSVIDNVYANKPQGNNADTNYHAINIFFEDKAIWLPNEMNQQPFSVDYLVLNETAIDELVAEIENM